MALNQDQEKFLNTLISNSGNVLKTAKETGIGRSTHYYWTKQSEYLERLEELKQNWKEDLREALFQAGTSGNATAAFFMLKWLEPEAHDDAVRKLKYMKDNDIEDTQKEITFRIVDAERALNTSNGMGSKADQ